jgi:EAL domain-containing protein (putative c-di-GMP-specific phosphodiesterase class I)
MLEITESLVLREEDHVLAELATLRNVGVRLAIDDFGTGFSSLSYLEQTPIDVIKIDKSFAGTLVGSERQRTVVEGVVQMAEKLGLQVVAEGVETVAQLGLLTEMRCPYGQGYLWAEPLDDVDAARWLVTQPVAPAPPAPPVLAPWPVPRPAPPADARPAPPSVATPSTSPLPGTMPP